MDEDTLPIKIYKYYKAGGEVTIEIVEDDLIENGEHYRYAWVKIAVNDNTIYEKEEKAPVAEEEGTLTIPSVIVLATQVIDTLFQGASTEAEKLLEQEYPGCEILYLLDYTPYTVINGKLVRAAYYTYTKRVRAGRHTRKYVFHQPKLVENSAE